MSKAMDESMLVQRLERALVERDVRVGFALLDKTLARTGRLDLKKPDAISLFLCMAQWADLGYCDLSFFDGLVDSTRNLDRARLPLLDFLKLRMAEAFRALAAEHPEESITALDLVLRAGENLLPQYLVFLANFWKGRAHRKRGDYEHASLHIAAARAAAERVGAPRLVAVTKIHESWLAFQKGERHSAFKLLDEAEVELRPTGHALSLGNIESARGRF